MHWPVRAVGCCRACANDGRVAADRFATRLLDVLDASADVPWSYISLWSEDEVTDAGAQRNAQCLQPIDGVAAVEMDGIAQHLNATYVDEQRMGGAVALVFRFERQRQ